jgi:hypothetical protein
MKLEPYVMVTVIAAAVSAEGFERACLRVCGAF